MRNKTARHIVLFLFFCLLEVCSLGCSARVETETVVLGSGPATGPPILREELPEKEERLRTPYWNVWFEDGTQVVPLSDIATDRTYNLVLDLSAYSFGDVLSALAASGETDKRVVEYVTKAQGTVKIRLRPIVTGAMWTEIEHRDVLLEIDRARFGPVSEDEDKLNRRFQDQEIDLRSFADQVRAAKVVATGLVPIPPNTPLTLPVKTGPNPGCGLVAFSVWDESGIVPLDHLAFTIQVGKQSAETDECFADGEQTNVFVTGLESLLMPAVNQKTFQGQQVAAGLHIFEVAVKKNKILPLAVFVDGRDPDPKNLRVIDWQLDVPLSEFLQNEVPALLNEAQMNAIDNNLNAYAYLAGKLRDRLFFDVQQDQKIAAESAWTMLKDIAREGRILLTRLVDRNGNMLYLPLGLLHAGGDSKPLDGTLTVVQALPRARYTRDDKRCVNTWSFMIPKKLAGAPENLLSDANRDTSSIWIDQIFEDGEHFKTHYLRYRAGEEALPESPAEGLLMVAHQSNGSLWFDSNAHKLSYGDIQRPYAPGSAAILAACEAAGIDDKNRLVLEQLNDRGVDLIIAAPYQVRYGYAAPLIIKLDQLIRDVYADRDPKRDRRVVKLFDEAAMQVQNKIKKSMADMKREFLILGDPEVSLCQPPQGNGMPQPPHRIEIP